MTIDFICGVLAELFESPCDFSPMDEYMLQDEYCEHHWGKVADKDCWKRYFEKRWADRKTELQTCNTCRNHTEMCLVSECHYEPEILIPPQHTGFVPPIKPIKQTERSK